MIIEDALVTFEKEPLVSPFGFKGSSITELWQSVVYLRGDNGNESIGLGVQSILWSDYSVFIENTEDEGNYKMLSITRYACKLSIGIFWDDPVKLLDKILADVHEFAKKLCRKDDLRLTFTLNALVAFDNAVWQLYARSKRVLNFDNLIPKNIKNKLSNKQEKLAAIPVVSYGMSIKEIGELYDDGFFFFKIKLGSDPDNDNDPYKMLEWDMNRLSEIHEFLKSKTTEYTKNKKIPYYLDANGRYPNKDFLKQFLKHAQKIGALEHIVVFEEPFDEDNVESVFDIPVVLAADESAHSDKDVLKRIKLGYKSIALKPIAKTLSMTMKILDVCDKDDVSCFCADLTVNPIMIDWNKNVASRLNPFYQLTVGVIESNGMQNYKNWNEMLNKHTRIGGEWIKPQN